MITVLHAAPFCNSLLWRSLEKTLETIRKEKYPMISLLCGIKKNGTNELIYKTEIELQM